MPLPKMSDDDRNREINTLKRERGMARAKKQTELAQQLTDRIEELQNKEGENDNV